ncbi:MAG: hypothetical protein DSY77_11955 [Bacteroidetes bacterium]|nr:MAG: hypothetical protein DSY77_11955 [Bacteroidota bacterium]
MINIRLIIISFLQLQSIYILAQDPLIVKGSEQQSNIEFLTELNIAPIFEYGTENPNIFKVDVSNALVLAMLCMVANF